MAETHAVRNLSRFIAVVVEGIGSLEVVIELYVVHIYKIDYRSLIHHRWEVALIWSYLGRQGAGLGYVPYVKALLTPVANQRLD